jgi:hypothetical protein
MVSSPFFSKRKKTDMPILAAFHFMRERSAPQGSYIIFHIPWIAPTAI